MAKSDVVLGEEKDGAEAEPGVAGIDAVGLAVAMDAARYDPELARKAGNYLEEQHRLVKLQIKHFDEERRLAIAAAKRKRFADRIRNTISAGLLLILGGALLGTTWMVGDAVVSKQVIVAPFDLSPTLAARSLNGKIVAVGLLDELDRLQAATKSSTQKAALANAWDGDIRIAVPETGLSIGEISRTLHERFGHDVHIDGSLVETPTQGLALTVRGTGVSPKTFSGQAAELEKLTEDAAAYVYGQSRPALWAAHLATTGRYVEAIAFARAALGRTQSVERARLLDMWSDSVGLSGGSLSEALSLARAAVKLNPEDWGAHADIQFWLGAMGDEEGAWRAGEEMKRLAGGRPGRAPEIQYQSWDLLTWNLAEFHSAIIADLDATGGGGTNFGAQWAYLAATQILLHDAQSAQLAISTAAYDEKDPVDRGFLHWVKALLADEEGNINGAAEEWAAYATAYSYPVISTSLANMICYAAPAFERAGRHVEADATLKAMSNLKYVDCYRFRADILDGRGDWPGAQRAYADAVALAPDLPAAYYSWGVALTRHGDVAGAAVKLKDANRRGPHWADPLKAWGDVLAKQGNVKDALAKYDDALKYAPNWKQLKETREALGKQKT